MGILDALEVGLFLLLIGTAFFWSGIKNIKQKRMMESTTTSKIASLAVGFSEINGKAIEKEKILSPFSNTPCVFWAIIVDEHDMKWKERKKEVSSEHFYLEDETGRIEISPNGAEIELPMNYELILEKVKEIPQPIQAYMLKNKMKTKGILKAHRHLRFREFIIKPNDLLYVLGSASINKKNSNEIRSNNNANLIMQKNKNLKYYYISTTSEIENLKSMKTRIPFSLVVGALIIGGGLLFFVL